MQLGGMPSYLKPTTNMGDSFLEAHPNDSYWWGLIPNEPDKKKKYDLRYISSWNVIATAAAIPALWYILSAFRHRTCALSADICHYDTTAGRDACVIDAAIYANQTLPFVAAPACYTISALNENAILATICFSTFLFFAGVLQLFYLTFGYDSRFRHYWALPTAILYAASVGAFVACGTILLVMTSNNEPNSPMMSRVKYVAGVVLTLGATLVGGIWVCYQSIESASTTTTGNEYQYKPVTRKLGLGRT
jgi:hypothetical protein